MNTENNLLYERLIENYVLYILRCEKSGLLNVIQWIQKYERNQNSAYYMEQVYKGLNSCMCKYYTAILINKMQQRLRKPENPFIKSAELIQKQASPE